MINQHGYGDKNSVIYNHITNFHITSCNGVNYLVDLLNIINNNVEREKFDRKGLDICIVQENIFTDDKARL